MHEHEAGNKDGNEETYMRNIGALIIRIGFWGPLYYKYNKEPQK